MKDVKLCKYCDRPTKNKDNATGEVICSYCYAKLHQVRKFIRLTEPLRKTLRARKGKQLGGNNGNYKNIHKY